MFANANIVEFNSKEVAKIEVSLDGGKTFSTLWEIANEIVIGPQDEGSKDNPLQIQLSSGESKQASYTWIAQQDGKQIGSGTKKTKYYSWVKSLAGQEILNKENHSVSLDNKTYNFDVYVQILYNDIPTYSCQYCGEETENNNCICDTCQEGKDEGYTYCKNCGKWGEPILVEVHEEESYEVCPYCKVEL